MSSSNDQNLPRLNFNVHPISPKNVARHWKRLINSRKVEMNFSEGRVYNSRILEYFLDPLAEDWGKTDLNLLFLLTVQICNDRIQFKRKH